MTEDIPDRLQGEDVTLHRAGRWWVAELAEPGLAVQGESRARALDKLATRLAEYTDRREGESWAEQFSSHETPDGRVAEPPTVERYLTGDTA